MYIKEQDPGYNLEERRKERKKKRKKRRLRLIRRIFIFLLFVSLCVFASTSSFFNIKNIELEDTPHCKKEEILSVINLAEGNNGFKSLIYDFKTFDKLLFLRYGKSEENILKKFSYVKEARVNYVIPGKVKIDIVEREPFAVVSGQAVNLLVDREGYVLDTVQDINSSKLLIINGIKFESFKLGQALDQNAVESIESVIGLFNIIGNLDSKDNAVKLASSISAVNVSDSRNVKLYVDSRISVNLGNITNADEMNYKINYLKEIIAKHIAKQQKGYIDFSIGENPRFTPG